MHCACTSNWNTHTILILYYATILPYLYYMLKWLKYSKILLSWWAMGWRHWLRVTNNQAIFLQIIIIANTFTTSNFNFSFWKKKRNFKTIFGHRECDAYPMDSSPEPTVCKNKTMVDYTIPVCIILAFCCCCFFLYGGPTQHTTGYTAQMVHLKV